MPAEKKDRHTGADNANGDSPNIFLLKRCSLDHQAPDPLSAPFRGQNPGGPLRAYNLARTSEFAIQSAYCSSSPGQKPASGSQAVAGVRAAAVLPSRWGGCKAAGLMESEPGLRSPEEYCLT